MPSIQKGRHFELCEQGDRIGIDGRLFSTGIFLSFVAIFSEQKGMH
jgi:hypothetical protein